MGCKALGICLLQCAIMHSAHAMTKGEGWVNGNNALMKRRQLQQWQPGSSPKLQPLSSVKHSLILLLPSRAEWFHLFTFATPPSPHSLSQARAETLEATLPHLAHQHLLCRPPKGTKSLLRQ